MVVFCEDAGVLKKRGHTRHHKRVLSEDERILRIERFGDEMDRILEEVFAGIGKPMVIPSMRILEAGVNLGLPQDVALHLFEVRKERYA